MSTQDFRLRLLVAIWHRSLLSIVFANCSQFSVCALSSIPTVGLASSHPNCSTFFMVVESLQVVHLPTTIKEMIKRRAIMRQFGGLSLALEARKLPVSSWEAVLPHALHSIRSLLSTATNETPHERMFYHNRRPHSGTSTPTWLCETGQVLMRSFNRKSKEEH